MGAYIINVPSTVDRIIYVHVDANTGKTAVVSQQMEDLTPYTAPDLEQVKKEAYQKGYETGYEDGYNEPGKNQQEAYQRGLNDAWDAAKKIGNMPYDEEEKAFGLCGWVFIAKHTASEAIEKIRQYEQEKEEIKVGDEVDWMGDKYVVTYVRREAKKADLISCQFGNACENVAFSALGKTGRHFDELATILEKMREESNG